VPPPTAPQPLAPAQSPPHAAGPSSTSHATDPGRSSPPHGERRPPESPRPAARAPEPEPSASVHSGTGKTGTGKTGTGKTSTGKTGGAETLPADDAYGPDDPGYGPPDPSWYERRKLEREREREREREEEEFLAEAAGEERPARGVFEPLSRDTGSGPAQPTSLDLLLNSDDGTDDDQDPLDRVKDMYLAAEAVSDTDLDRRFEELLERQRKLISAYFKQSRPPVPDRIGDNRMSMSGDLRATR
jgi:hypothetical protein